MIVQPWRIRVIGTRFLVRLSVASANSPLGCQATPSSRFDSGTTHRSSTLFPSTSRTVTSDIGGVRNLTKRERAFVTSSRFPSGERAADHGLRLAARRFASLPLARSTTETASNAVPRTKSVFPVGSTATPCGSSATGIACTTLRVATSMTLTLSLRREVT